MPAFLKTPRARAYLPLPLGSVTPRGWLREQLEIQADGLHGHLDEVWDVVGPSNAWRGGDGENWELAPYWLDGLVPLAYLLDSDDLKGKSRPFIEWVLTHTGSDGWLGPRTDHQDIWWPRAVILKVLAQYAEATGDRRIEPAMTAYFGHLKKHLPENPLRVWAHFRWGDYLPSLLWLCARRGCDSVVDVAHTLWRQGYDWTDHFRFFRIEDAVEHPNLATHVVNHAMAFKYPGLVHLFTGDETARQNALDAPGLVERFHGQATGMFTGDEHLAGLNPSRGTELCGVVEFMYALEMLFSLLGEPVFGDRLESVAYNNLPAAFDADMWTRQYDQQANQVLCSVTERPWSNNAEANIFGLTSQYACCTANFGQGWPKFVSHMWMRTPGGGLAAAAYGPSRVETAIDGVRVSIEEETDYPFGSEIVFEVRCDETRAFPLVLRIPGWAEGATVQVGGDEPLKAAPGSMHAIERRWKRDRVVLTLPQRLRTSRGYNGSVRVHRGPLTFALRIESEWKQVGGTRPAVDYEVYPRSPWNYGLAIDPENPEGTLAVEERSVRMPCFSEDRAPVEITAPAARLPQWGMEHAMAAPPPESPAEHAGPVESVTLIPYGAAKLRITEFPLVRR